MKYTLLDMVQTILSGMSSDEVNSITDNEESIAVARIIRGVYYDIVAAEHMPENFRLFSLEASTDATKPVLMTRPTNANSIQWVKYNKATITDTNPNWIEIKYMPIKKFLDIVHRLV